MNTVDIFCSRGYRFILPKTLFKPLRRRSRKPDKKKRLSAQILEKPPSYKEGQVETVWENAKKDPAKTFFEKDGIKYIRDRKGIVVWNKDIPRNGQWDMGHLPDQKYSDMYDLFIRGDVSEVEFLKWYRNAENYEPQTIPFNRGHKGE